MIPTLQTGKKHMAREELRLATRRVLLAPASIDAHHNRLRAAQKINAAEPLQAAFVDMLCSLPPASIAVREWLSLPATNALLATHVKEILLGAADSDTPLPRVNPLATRWCVIAIPSCNVPERARLSNTDDSRAMATRAIQQANAGNEDAVCEFLAYCAGTRDKLAFMLAFTALSRDGVTLTQAWYRVMDVLLGKPK